MQGCAAWRRAVCLELQQGKKRGEHPLAARSGKAFLYNCRVKTAVIAILLCLAGLIPEAASAQTPAKAQRLALVIGNGAYKDAPLPNPLNDAADMARVLEASGFTVIKRENASLKEMHLALREFGDRLGRQSTGLFFFAGHGMQVRGRNYLLPVDADIAREDEVAFSALDLGAVMEKIDSAKNPVNIVVLDACRNNPFGNRLTATTKGLAQVEAPPGTLIAFATAPGSTAADGSGRNGLYTQHLVKQIDRAGLAIEEVFKAVRAGVRTESKGAQIPWESTSLESMFRFRSAPKAPTAAAKAPAAIVVAKAAPTSLRAPPAFHVGDTWTYRVVNQLDEGERPSVMKIAAIRGEEVHYASGSIGDHYGNFKRIVRGSGPERRVEEFSPATHQYVFPLRTGEVSRFKAVQTVADRVFDLDEQIKVGDEEEVETPAGRMMAVRIDRVVQWKQRGSDNGGTNTFAYWYNAAAKRYIAIDQENVTSKGKVTLKERQELVMFAVN